MTIRGIGILLITKSTIIVTTVPGGTPKHHWHVFSHLVQQNHHLYLNQCWPRSPKPLGMEMKSAGRAYNNHIAIRRYWLFGMILYNHRPSYMLFVRKWMTFITDAFKLPLADDIVLRCCGAPTTETLVIWISYTTDREYRREWKRYLTS